MSIGFMWIEEARGRALVSVEGLVRQEEGQSNHYFKNSEEFVMRAVA